MKTILLAGAVVFGLLPSVLAYSLEGPVGNGGDAWQVSIDGFGPPRDTVAPKNLGEEYRHNIPVVYYAYDATFLDYFGSTNAINGVSDVDGAFAILASAFTNNPTGVARGLDGYSAELSEFPINSRHINYQAQALGLFDLKSSTLGILMEQLGLADPVNYIWGIHDRFLPPGGTCPPSMQYLVVMRNFDYISTPLNQLQYSAYVNDTLYSYDIVEVCQNAPILAEAVPFAVDPLADIFLPVASWFNSLSWGDYYTGLTRDDVAGLKYLMRTNNINMETADVTSRLFTISTNFSLQQLFPNATGTNFISGTNGAGFYVFDGTFGYGDYGALVANSITNSPAVLQALYPGLVIASSTNYFVIATNWTFFQYFTNSGVGSTFPPPLVLVTASNAHPFLLQKFVTTFANVFPNKIRPTTSAQLQTTLVQPQVGSPFPAPLVTNVTTKTIIQNNPSGDFFLFTPFYTNVCPLDILYTGLTNVLIITNVLASANTNVVTPTNTSTFTSTLTLINFFTNYTFVVNPVTCTQSGPTTNLYQGIEKIKFVKSSYDSLLGQFFQPITNNYTLVAITNSQAIVQKFQRVVTAPDFRFAASDQLAGPAGVPLIGVFQQTFGFDQGNVLPGLAGPGTITGPTTITFEKVGPAFFNTPSDVMNGTPYFTETPGGDISDLFYSVYFIWGSFDGTTNAPVVYPNGTSIDNLASQVLVQITTTPTGPLVASRGAFYNVQFRASGGSFMLPFTWSGSGVPAGLSIVSNADNSATLSGTPTQSGAFVFTLTLTDSLARSVQWRYSLTIQ